jgi:hypothetical protein
MTNDFKNAVAFATGELQGFYDRGGSFTALNQKGRSELLEVFSDDYDWQPNLINAAKDFHSFDGLKRYCAHLIRTEKQIPDQLKHWISDLLEDVLPRPKKPRGGTTTGLENNFLLPRLVEKVAVKFQLERTRNDASDQLSACDAVHQAIIKTSEASDIRSRQYYTIKRAYLAAKKRGIFVGH